ncbi:MAG: hypothetical protein HQL40_20610, partial [Alphaproteobacteria bacterium]|nr:hypothetical protein [Alphaproteobacteria bacterium]
AMLARASTPPPEAAPAQLQAAPPQAQADAAARRVTVFGKSFAFRLPKLDIALPSLPRGGRDAVGPVLSKLKFSLGAATKAGRGKKTKSRPMVMLAPIILTVAALLVYVLMSPDGAEILELLLEGL